MPTTLKRRYIEHRANAQARGIAFQLTFEQWEWLWVESGKLAQRGWRKGQYVMARPGDKGAYEVGNVIICLAEENRAERNRNYALAGDKNPAFGKNYWVAAPESERVRRAAHISRRFLGKPKSETAKTNMAAAARRDSYGRFSLGE